MMTPDYETPCGHSRNFYETIYSFDSYGQPDGIQSDDCLKCIVTALEAQLAQRHLMADSYAGLLAEKGEAVEFHPRAMKLIAKRKNFVAVAEDEPYFSKVYGLIRYHEQCKGTWTEGDEELYRIATQPVAQPEAKP